MPVSAKTPVYFHSFSYITSNDPPLFSKTSKPASKSTNDLFLESCLLSSGVTSSKTIGSLNTSISTFVTDMHDTECYEKFNATLEPAKDESGNIIPQAVHVKLEAKEKNWYRIHIGGDLKQSTDGISGGGSMGSSNLTIPEVQMTSSLTLRNLSGSCGLSKVAYNVSQTGSTSFNLGHVQPVFNEVVGKGERRYGVEYDEVDWEEERSYRETKKGSAPSSTGSYLQTNWSLTLRNILPTLHPTIPYAHSSPSEIISESGPNLKHSLKLTAASNGAYLRKDKYVPGRGIDSKLELEFAGPPGDTGFIKSEFSSSLHIPLYSSLLTHHICLNSGILKVLNFGGLCNPVSNVSDRFFGGGVLRGFKKGGIGPRCKTEGEGGTLGGEVYHNASFQLSTPFPHPVIEEMGGRVFCFTNFMALSNLKDVASIKAVKDSTRVSVGAGVAVPLASLGRLEASWSKVLRKGEGDLVQPMQFGLNFCVG
ncbi:hypothetical protein TrLO_g12515 [Triparma laevis f. longispina]|uniref:Bacterial surface antigen (D15) domain-containing protein n=1 Tax=Triparma laevis f. longispina TaxID=1714387 RepID=A0A9W7KX48_9STRA|nr:hypothetical protein TrLO_g12515 [Triparma laevis f. longispina]